MCAFGGILGLSCKWGDLLSKDVRGGEVFGLRAGARGLGGGQGARGEVLSVKIP
jgi:hypothetical protein